MKRFLTLYKAAIITVILLAVGHNSHASVFTATASGSWTSSATWGGTAPGVNISGADVVTIPVGITVTLDSDVSVTNVIASVAVNGTLTGSSHGMSMTAGTLTGAGSVNIDHIVIGASGYLTATGTVAVNQFTNSQLLLAISGNVNVANSVTFTAGVVQLNSGSAVHLANNVTLNMAGGGVSLNGGSIVLAGSYNLIYSGSTASVGAEAALSGLQNVTVNLASSSSQILMSADLTVAGALSVSSGVLVLNGYNLTTGGAVTA